MNKKYPLIGLLVIALTNPALLKAAPVIGSDADLIRFLGYSPTYNEGKLTGAFEMNGVTGIDTPAHNGGYLYSFNGHGETVLGIETGSLVSLINGVYTWEGGGSITQSGALGRDTSPDGDSGNYIVPDITFLTGKWDGPITAQIEESGNFVIRGAGTNIIDQTLLDYYGIAAADNSWQFSFALSLLPNPGGRDDSIFGPNGRFDTGTLDGGYLTFYSVNTATEVPAPATLILFIIGLVILGFCHTWRKRSNCHHLFDSGIA